MIYNKCSTAVLLAAAMAMLTPVAAEAQYDPSFPAGTWTAQLYGTAATGSEGQIYTLQGGLGYHFWDNVSINLEPFGGRIDSSIGSNAALGGLDLLVRWHVLNAPNWTVFLDGGAGLQRATHRFPDSHFNFRPQVGIGGTLRLTEELHLIGGLRWLHISNAGRTDLNPGYDAAQAYVGMMVSF